MADILKGLNQQQKEAVTTTKGPLLIIAGAGTGKTSVITRRIAYIIEKKLAKPSEILGLTFTEKAAAEMEERVDVLVPYGYIDTWISTFHAFGDRILREKALDLGLPPDFQVLTRPQANLFFQQNLFAFDLNYYRPLANPTKFIEAILAFISRCKDEDVSPEQYQKYIRELKSQKLKAKSAEEKREFLEEIKRQEELGKVYEQYERLKTAAGKIDYGDQVLMTLNLFRRRPKILKEYQQKFKYILVDEYQDTNYAQNELVKLLAKSHQNICVVGDDDQSIYKFRGAAISNILEFKKAFKKSKQIVLATNYRSTQNLLDAGYRLIRFNDPDRLEVKNKINKKLTAGRSVLGEGPTLVTCPTLSEETDFVASEIEKLTKSKLDFKETAILIRANSQADPFLRALNLKGIPHKFVGFSGLYNQPEVKVLISFLTAISNFDDSLNLYNLAASVVYNLPPEDCIVAMDLAKRRSRTLHYVFKNLEKLEEIQVSEAGRETVKQINTDVEKFLDLSRRENVGKVLYEFIQRTKYLEKLEKQGVEAEVKIQNIAKFFDKIKEFIDLSQNESVRAFIDYLEIMRLAGDDPATAEADPEQNAVNVMTVHAAKGLEFKVVFMVGLDADHFPSRERGEPISLPEVLIKEVLPLGDYHVQEERRLFYVGTTRAKSRLYYTWSKDVGGKRFKKISPFVLEALDRPKMEESLQQQTVRGKIEQFAGRPPTPFSAKRESEIIRLTQASIDDYETCAYKYRYAHVLRVPILRHHTVIYGYALHAAVAEFYRQKMVGKTLNLESTLEVLENAWISEGFLTAEHEEKRLIQAKEVIRNFWNREKKSREIPTFIEKPFRFNLNGRKTKVLVSGRFDRVDVDGEKVRIIDFKSTEGRTHKNLEKDAKKSIQLKVYTLGYYKNYQVIPEFVGIYDLDSGLAGGYEPEKEALEKTENEIIEVSQNIKQNLQNNNFPANPKYFGRVPACNYCAYNSICPFSLANK
ncbi:MAG TPA: ATP-dependent DNA helicase [Candidatus Nanoarchaeia archaeon]